MNQKGFAPIFILVGVLVIVLIAGGVIYYNDYANQQVGKVNKEASISETSNTQDQSKLEQEKSFNNTDNLKGGLLFLDQGTIYFFDKNTEKVKLANFPILSKLENLQLSPSNLFLVGIQRQGKDGLPNGPLIAINIQNGETKNVCEEDTLYRFTGSFHPEKDLVVYLVGSDLITCDVSQNKRKIIAQNIKPFNFATFSPKGSKILVHYAHGGPSVGSDYAVINSDGSNLKSLPMIFTETVDSPIEWDKDDSGIMIKIDDKIQLYSLSQNTFKTLFALPKGTKSYDIHSSSDKLVLAITDEKQKSDNVYILDVKTNNLKKIINFDTTDFSLSPWWWGDRILFWRTNRESFPAFYAGQIGQPTKDLWVMNEDGSNLKKLIDDIDRPHKQLYTPR